MIYPGSQGGILKLVEIRNVGGKNVQSFWATGSALSRED